MYIVSIASAKRCLSCIILFVSLHILYRVTTNNNDVLLEEKSFQTWLEIMFKVKVKGEHLV